MVFTEFFYKLNCGFSNEAQVKVDIKVQPRSSLQKVARNPDGSLKVYLRSAPSNGKANKELRQVIAEFYKIRKSTVKIITGHTSRNKIIEIKE